MTTPATKTERVFSLASNAGQRFSFAITGPYGALEFWFSPSPPGYPDNERYYGGVEKHFNRIAAPAYLTNGRYGYREDCSLVPGGCFHDGSSLWASEHWIPGMMRGGSDWIWAELESRYFDCMKPENDNERTDQ